jgi:hypothetical protein
MMVLMRKLLISRHALGRLIVISPENGTIISADHYSQRDGNPASARGRLCSRGQGKHALLGYPWRRSSPYNLR